MGEARGSWDKAHDERYRKLIDLLTAQRKELGLSQEALAERLGHHQQFVSRYETYQRRLDVVEFADVTRTLGLDIQILIGSVIGPG
jgi:ribosome-binding protein aMBF1 (putative translation factor)